MIDHNVTVEKLATLADCPVNAPVWAIVQEAARVTRESPETINKLLHKSWRHTVREEFKR